MRFPVSTEKEKDLMARLAKVGVREEDLVEKFIRSGGPGGQHVNKTSTAVYLCHVPSGIEIKSQEARSQALNRYNARKRLADELEARLLGEKSKREKAIFKLRKQKQRRSKRAKEKVLEHKHHQAGKKRERSFKPKDE